MYIEIEDEMFTNIHHCYRYDCFETVGNGWTYNTMYEGEFTNEKWIDVPYKGEDGTKTQLQARRILGVHLQLGRASSLETY